MRLPERDPYAPREWQPRETRPAGFTLHAGAQHAKADCLWRCRSAGLPDGRPGMRWSPPTCKICRAPLAPVNRDRRLPAVYVMTNISINLLLVKFRQQYGLRAFTEGFLVLYVLVTFPPVCQRS